MASLIEGYEYDVFISYRQNDNKYDGWVTAFVHNLTLELEATIKDKVSVYFDIDPSDGLLETHSVDRSLEDKLKCLIFIPIISRTYCDKNAFAWQNEFCAFNRLSEEDRFGRDVRLAKGNFGSRILPVKIHELDDEDRMLIENELGASLRSIDFIYKSAGVNRPLRANEDHPQDNLNNTYYRDQINKVANSISEILLILKHTSITNSENAIPVITETALETVKNEPGKKVKRKTFSTGGKFWIVAIGLVAILAIALKFLYPTGFVKGSFKRQRSSGDRISIAVMPFHNMTNDSTLNFLRLGGQEGVVSRLSFYPEDFNVRSFELVRNFIKSDNISNLSLITNNSGSRISKKLDADIFLLGDIYKSEKKIRLNAQLIDSKTEEIIRSFQAEGIYETFINTIDSLAEMVRNFLMLSKIDKNTFKPDPVNPHKLHYLTTSPEAYRYHFLASEAFYSFDFHTAIKLDSQAVAIDSNFVTAIVSLCWENFGIANFEEATKWLFKAYKKRDQMPLVTQLKLDYQYANLFQTPDEQMKCLRQLLKIEDNNPRYYQALGYQYVNLSRYDESIPELEKAREIYRKWGSEPTDVYYFQYLIKAYHKTGKKRKTNEVLHKAEKILLSNDPQIRTGDRYLKLALVNANAGLYSKAEEYFKKASSSEPAIPNTIYLYATSLIENDLNVKEGLDLIESALESDPENGNFLNTKGWGLFKQHNYPEALNILEKAYRVLPSFEIKAHIDSVNKAIISQK